MKRIYKTVQLAVFVLGFSMTALAQPKTNYWFCTALSGRAEIQGQDSEGSFSCGYTGIEYIFKHGNAEHSGTYVLNLPRFDEGGFLMEYIKRTVVYYYIDTDFDRCDTYTTDQRQFEIGVSYTDQRLRGTRFYVCKSNRNFDLGSQTKIGSSDVRYNLYSSSRVRYYLDGSTTANSNVNGSSILDASQLTVGIHTFIAKLTYDNGEDISSAVEFEVYDRPTIADDALPSSFEGCPNGEARLLLAVGRITGGGTYTYQWQQKIGDGWNNCAEGTAEQYSNFRTANFKMIIPENYAYINGRKYRVEVNNECTNGNGVASSKEPTLIILQNPRISDILKPADVTAFPGATATFEVSYDLPANYTEAQRSSVSFQWQYKAPREQYQNVSGTAGNANRLSVNIPSTPGTYNGYLYKCIVSGVCAHNGAVSREALLTVPGAVTITAHPQNISACPGATVQFRASGTYGNGGSTADRTWQRATANSNSFENIPNESSDVLSIRNILQGNSGDRFRCLINDACTITINGQPINSKYTNVAVLTVYGLVTASVPPVPTGFQVCDGSPFSCTVSPTAENSGNRSFQYQWAYSANGTDFTNCTAGYEGEQSNRLSFSPTIDSHANYQYKCTVSDDCGYQTRMTTVPFTLTVNPIPNAPTVAEVRICGEGEEHRLTATATSPNSVAPIFRWYANENDQTSDRTRTGESYTIDNVTTNTYRYVEVEVIGCTSSRTRASYLYYAKKPVPFTNKTLCSTQAPYNMESELTDEASKRGTFSWVDGTNTSHRGNIFNPVGLARNEPYTIRYTPTDVAKLPIDCYKDTDFQITVVDNMGNNGIRIDPALAPNKTVNLCVGDAPFDLYSIITPKTGEWFTTDGSDDNALNKTSSTATYRASESNVTGAIAHQVEYRVVANGCATSDRLKIFVSTIPAAPIVPDVKICDSGPLTSIANSPNSHNPVFRWYANENDHTPVHTGSRHTVNNVTDNTYYYVEVTTDKGCTSPRTRASYLYFAKQRVPFPDKTLCNTKPAYNMESELTDDVSKGGAFSWTNRNNTLYSGVIFNTALFEVRDEPYIINYIPLETAKLPPSCYTDTRFNITVVGSGGNNRITIDPVLAPNKTVNLCVGGAPFDLYSIITPKTGEWLSDGIANDNALNKTTEKATYLATDNNVTITAPHRLKYQITIEDCLVVDWLNIFVKKNRSVAVMSGIPDNICPGQKFTVTSTIQDSGDTERYSFEYSDPNGDPNAYVSLSNNNPFEYSVERDYQIAVVSIDNTYRCKSAVVKKWIRTPFGSGVINVSSQVVNVGESVAYTFNGLSNSTFAWDFGDGERGNIQNPVKYYHKPGDFKTKLRVTSSLGCSKDFELPVAVAGAEPQVVTALREAMPSIYPNPVQSVLHIEGGGKIELFNELGQAQPFALHENGIDMSHLASGVYVLVVEKNHYRVIKK